MHVRVACRNMVVAPVCVSVCLCPSTDEPILISTSSSDYSLITVFSKESARGRVCFMWR